MAISKYNGKVISTFSKALDAPDKFENTHKHSLKVLINGEETFVNFGANKMDAFMVEDDDGKWQVLGKDSDVVFKYTDREYNGKTYYDAKKSDLVVMELVVGEKYKPKAPEAAPAAAQAATAGGKKPYVDNSVGMGIGLATNNSFNLFNEGKISETDIPVAIYNIYTLAEAAKALAAAGKLEELSAYSFSLLGAPVAAEKPVQAPAKAAPAAKKPAKAKEPVKAAPEPDNEDPGFAEDDDNLDQDVPF